MWASGSVGDTTASSQELKWPPNRKCSLQLRFICVEDLIGSLRLSPPILRVSCPYHRCSHGVPCLRCSR